MDAIPFDSTPAAGSPGPLRLHSAAMRAPDDTDESLMLAYAAGEAAAFETLYGRHRRGLYGFLQRQSPRAAWVDDLFQESWLAVVKARADYRPSAAFRTWLYGIARNKLIDRVRLHEPALLADFAAAGDEADPLAQVTDGTRAAPEAQLANKQLGRSLAEALRALPANQREVFLLREQAELNLAEIAELTGVTQETAKSRLRYALAKLRGLLAAEVAR